MSPWETALDRARRVHAERLKQIKQEKYAAKEQERAKVGEAQYRDRTAIMAEGDEMV